MKTHFVDVDKRAPSPGELRRFIQRFGAEALVDRGSPRFAELGLSAAHLSEERWAAKLAEEPRLLRMPLVRWRQRLTVGRDEAAWSAWLEEAAR